MINPIYGRTELLLGEQAMEQLANKRVIIFGVGGVGSWCAEGLLRSGIVHLTLVDYDCVSTSNVNRQLMATTSSVGQVKVEELKKRLLDINPDADIMALRATYSAQTASTFHIEEYDYVIDAIDSLQDKIDLITEATSLPVTLFSSMGAARKMDPTKIKVTEFWKVQGCPLAAALRRRMKRLRRFPNRKFLCVYSDELLPNKGVNREITNSHKQINGTLVHITAIFGLNLAWLVIQDAIKNLGYF